MSNVTTVFLAVTLFLVLIVVGTMDYEDQVLAEQLYIDNVCQGIHPDYERRGVSCD